VGKIGGELGNAIRQFREGLKSGEAEAPQPPETSEKGQPS
jgi:Sec-independent protein translocase protein TatA